MSYREDLTLESCEALERCPSELTALVEGDIERDLAARVREVLRYEQEGHDNHFLRRDDRFEFVDAADLDSLSSAAIRNGAVVSGRLYISYHRGEGSGLSERRVMLMKTLLPGSTFAFARSEDPVLAAEPGTRLLRLRTTEHDVGPEQGSERNVEKQIGAKLDTATIVGLSDDELLSMIEDLDYQDVRNLQRDAYPLLREIGERRELIRSLLIESRADRNLRVKCECLPDMYKFVLRIGSESGARLRLHIFRTEYEDVPHSHRWPMCSYILRGTVMNKYYGSDSDLEKTYDRQTPTACMSHRMTEGSCYSFDHQVVHWFHGSPGAISLTIRGPLNKDVSTEFGEGSVNLKFGADAKMEPVYTMTPGEFDFGLQLLRTANVI